MMWWYVQTVYFIPTVRLICEAPGFPMWNRSVSSADRGVGEKKKKGGGERDRATVNKFKTKPSLPWELRFFYSCPATAAEYRCVVISSHCWGEQRSHEIHFIDFGLGVMARDNHERIIDEERNGRWHMPNTKSLISVSPTLLFLVWFNFLPLTPTRLPGYSAAKEWIKSKRATDRHFWPTVHLSVCEWVLPAETRSLDDVKIVQKVCVNSFAVKKHYYLNTLSVCSHLEKSYSIV